MPPGRPGFDAFLLDGHFLGELCDGAYVLRDAFRADPVTRAPRPAVHHRAPSTRPRSARSGTPWTGGGCSALADPAAAAAPPLGVKAQEIV